MTSEFEIIARLDRIEQMLVNLAASSQGEHRMDMHLVKTLGVDALKGINKRKRRATRQVSL